MTEDVKQDEKAPIFVWRWFLIAHVLINLAAFAFQMMDLLSPLGMHEKDIISTVLVAWGVCNIGLAIVIVIKKIDYFVLILPILTVPIMYFLLWGALFSPLNVVCFAIASFFLTRGRYQGSPAEKQSSRSNLIVVLVVIIGGMFLLNKIFNSIAFQQQDDSINSPESANNRIPSDLNQRQPAQDQGSQQGIVPINENAAVDSQAGVLEVAFKADVAGLFVETRSECAQRNLTDDFFAQERKRHTNIRWIEMVAQSCGSSGANTFQLNALPYTGSGCRASITEQRPQYTGCTTKQ